MIQVIDKFLEEKELEKIDFLFSETNLPWFFNASSIYAHGDPNAQDDKKFMFTHMFMFEGKVNSDFYPVIEPIINKLKTIINFNLIYRIKANLYTNQGKHIEHTPHQDLNRLGKKYYTAIYFINSNNGKTIIKDIEIPSIKNTLLLFDGDTDHYGVTQTNTQTRMVININVTNEEH
jgi:hypothetical protein